MTMNRSGTCATSKLLQCRNFGVYECDIASKFAGPPQAAPDLSTEDFYARKYVVRQVQQWVEANAQKKRHEEVRATYTTTTSKELPAGFMSFTDAPIESTQQTPIFHVTPATFTPSLLEGELEKIDNILAGTRFGDARRSYGGIKSGRAAGSDALMSAKKRARQSEYTRRRSRAAGSSVGVRKNIFSSPGAGNGSASMDVDD
ncbi:hypothetical protein EWM64_g1223 [Hericium alpestre]|uniref:Uncharacterized protein n=1 Tax=Hericium alpestre TaxID=135208 RepID=A0A4Z0A6X2_9AGAM|nr:hypothetical protein EWM64_g1223 [Hericium alpestre]